jgi:hypothetical protein|tara:strand:+ start:388 stop:777 length:390 start_codon:yes stop_codon:yes gene_type:complete
MPTPVNSPQPWTIALSAGTGDLETGTAVVTTRAPYALALTQLPRISVSTAPVGSVLTVDINAGATSPATILSTKLTIDAGEKTSVTASTPAVLSSTTMADNDIITFDIDGVGSGTAGVGLQITLYVTRL